MKDLSKLMEQSFRDFFSNNVAIMLLIDPETLKIVDANPAAEKYYGWDHAQLTSMSIAQINTLSSSEIMVEIDKARTQQRNYFRFRHRKADGSICSVEGFSSKVVFGAKELLLSIIHDVTGQEEAEAKLKHNQNLMGYIIEHDSSAVAVHDKNLNYIYVSQQYLDQYKIKDTNIIGRHHYDVFPDLPQKWRDVHQRALKGEVISADADPYLRDDGHTDWTRWECRPWYEANGSIGGMIIYTQIITGEIQTIEELRKLSRAVEQSPASVVITDPKGLIEYVNPKFVETTGYSFEEVKGKNTSILKSGKHADEFYKELWETIKLGKEWKGEFNDKKKNGELYWESASISPIMNNEGKIVNYLAVKEDITERKKMIEDLIAAKERAEHSDRLKSAFLANMSHEIRTPMNSIMGFASLLPDEESRELMTQYANIIVQNSEQLVHVIDGIVLYSRLQAKILTVNACEFKICDLLHDLKQSFSVLNFNADLELHTQNMIGSNALLNTDYEKIRQIYANLISNAFKYTSAGTITIGAEMKNNQVTFYVKDTGVGISKDEIEKIFERFFRGKNVKNGSISGTGLGLSIVKELIDLLGGKIWVESNSDPKLGEKGSTFFFKLSL
ncbi:MAG TPA: PAS domain S-box protein [Prolixibacteraceae bacterium]|nr:PAS domain S-box protein [Prolixibacteraceae bacterium]